jgi:fibronectin type 3 domain-containing protein
VENQTDAAWAQIGESTVPTFDDTTFEYGKKWQYYVQAVRKVGDNFMESDASATFTFAPTDRFPPAVPTGLVVIPGTKTIELSWDRVTDSDLAGYRVYRNGVRIADALVNSGFSDKDVVTGMKYSYEVSAVNSAGYESRKCEAMEAAME